MSEQDTLRELVTDILTAGSQFDTAEALWETFADAGLFDIGIDEDAGGSGGTVSDLTAIIEAVGAAGSTVPIVEFSIARWILAASVDRGDKSGSATAVLVELTEDDVLTGNCRIESVAAARSVDTVVVCVSGGRSFAVSTNDPGVDIESVVDLSSGASDTVNISANAVRRPVETTVSPQSVADRFALLRAAALSGAIRGSYELTRAYVRTREQFGAPLVKLPAVASGIATIRTKVLESRAAVDGAVESESSGEARGSMLSIAARVVTARCATETARLAHQLHGAMGTTKEYTLHNLTTALWVWRDADLPESEWARALGESVVRTGEASAWDSLGAGVR